MRVVTWNLQGNRGLDAAAAAELLHDLVDVDEETIVLAQEIQRGQSIVLQRELGAPYRRWSFKHWGIRVAPEGLAVFAWVPIRVRTQTLSRRTPPWGWQRRIAQVVRWNGTVLVNTHLATGDDGSERMRQVERIRAGRGGAATVLVGDWNESDGPATTTLGGWRRDAWTTCHGDLVCVTNWSTDDRSAAPDQLLDRIWSDPRLGVRRCEVGDWRRVAPVSDHLPVVAEFGPPDSA